MEEDIQCSECGLLVQEYKQTEKPEGRDDICEYCYIVELSEKVSFNNNIDNKGL
jgi:hypothetical protein